MKHAQLNIEDKQKVNGNLQVDCTEYVKDKYQKELKKQKNQKTSFAKITYKQVLSGGSAGFQDPQLWQRIKQLKAILTTFAISESHHPDICYTIYG